MSQAPLSGRRNTVGDMSTQSVATPQLVLNVAPGEGPNSDEIRGPASPLPVRGNVVFSWSSQKDDGFVSPGSNAGTDHAVLGLVATTKPVPAVSPVVSAATPLTHPFLNEGAPCASAQQPGVNATIQVSAPNVGVLTVPTSPAIAQAVLQSAMTTTAPEKTLSSNLAMPGDGTTVSNRAEVSNTEADIGRASGVTTVETSTPYHLSPHAVSTEPPHPYFNALTEQLEQTHARYRAGLLEPREYHQQMAQLMVQLHSLHGTSTAAALTPLRAVAGCPAAVTPTFIAHQHNSANASPGTAVDSSHKNTAANALRDVVAANPQSPHSWTFSQHNFAPKAGNQKSQSISSPGLDTPAVVLGIKLIEKAQGPENALFAMKVLFLASLSIFATSLEAQLDIFVAAIRQARPSAAEKIGDLSAEDFAAINTMVLPAVSTSIKDILCNRSANTSFQKVLGGFANSTYKTLKRQKIIGLGDFHEQLRQLATEGPVRRWDGCELLGFVVDFLKAVDKLKLAPKCVVITAVFKKLLKRYNGNTTAALKALYHLVDAFVPHATAIADIYLKDFIKVNQTEFEDTINMVEWADKALSGTSGEFMRVVTSTWQHGATITEKREIHTPEAFFSWQERIFEENGSPRDPPSSTGFFCEMAPILYLYSQQKLPRVAVRKLPKIHINSQPCDPPGIAGDMSSLSATAASIQTIDESEVLTQTDRLTVQHPVDPTKAVVIKTLISEQSARMQTPRGSESSTNEMASTQVHRAAVNTYTLEADGKSSTFSFAAPPEMIQNAPETNDPFGTIGLTLHGGIVVTPTTSAYHVDRSNCEENTQN